MKKGAKTQNMEQFIASARDQHEIAKLQQEFAKSPAMQAFRNWVIATNSSKEHVEALIGLHGNQSQEELAVLMQVAGF